MFNGLIEWLRALLFSGPPDQPDIPEVEEERAMISKVGMPPVPDPEDDPPTAAYEVERFAFGLDSTLSRLWSVTHGNRLAIAVGVEDERRRKKVFAETCIPLGVYRLALRTHGGFHARYRKRFPGFHVGMIEVMDVPGFTDILWHIGNDDEDTAGCLLIGSYPVVTPDCEFEVAASERQYRIVYPGIAASIASGEPIYVAYTERRPA